jgi:formylglycine-generating enzyme required for sulfatase activity
MAPIPAPPPTAAQQAVLKGTIAPYVLGFVAETGIRLVPIPAGTFLLGSPEGEPGRAQDEGPQTRVTLTQDFFLGATPVTRAQWFAVMSNLPELFKGSFKGVNLAMDKVPWDKATAFCQKLTNGERTAGRLPAGWRFALPTEAQWEYACRAGTTGSYAGQPEAMAWSGANSGGTMPVVGAKMPNAWGLFDMHGNVFEWCRDWYGLYPGGEVTDPAGPAMGDMRIYRGGDWRTFVADGRSAFRGHVLSPPPDFAPGLRVALEPPAKE